MDLAIVGVAVNGVSEKGICKDVKIALGAVAPPDTGTDGRGNA